MGSLGAAGAALAAAAFAVAPAAVTPRVPLTQVPLADVVDVLPLDVQGPALYVLVVDTSASMQESGAYPAVAAAITDVLGALEPTDRVSVVTFDAAPRQCGAGVFPASDPAMITACLPPAAEGEYTDVGRAFEQVLTVLETTPAAVRTVVLISDGAHEPGPGSAYPAGAGEGGEGWRRLADRARTVRDVSAYSLPLSGADDGAASLGAVFASPTVLQAASPDEVRAALGVPPAAARRTEARSILAPDAMAGIEVEAPSPPDVGPEPVTWEVTLRSAAAHVPWTVRDLTLEAGRGVEVLGVPPAVELAPGEAVTVTATLRATGPDPGGGPARLRASLASGWADALDELGLAVPTEVVADLGVVTVVADPAAAPGTVSLPPAVRWGAGVAGLGVVAAGAAMAWWILRGRSARPSP